MKKVSIAVFVITATLLTSCDGKKAKCPDGVLVGKYQEVWAPDKAATSQAGLLGFSGGFHPSFHPVHIPHIPHHSHGTPHRSYHRSSGRHLNRVYTPTPIPHAVYYTLMVQHSHGVCECHTDSTTYKSLNLQDSVKFHKD